MVTDSRWWRKWSIYRKIFLSGVCSGQSGSGMCEISSQKCRKKQTDWLGHLWTFSIEMIQWHYQLDIQNIVSNYHRSSREMSENPQLSLNCVTDTVWHLSDFPQLGWQWAVKIREETAPRRAALHLQRPYSSTMAAKTLIVLLLSVCGARADTTERRKLCTREHLKHHLVMEQKEEVS